MTNKKIIIDASLQKQSMALETTKNYVAQIPNRWGVKDVQKLLMAGMKLSTIFGGQAIKNPMIRIDLLDINNAQSKDSKKYPFMGNPTETNESKFNSVHAGGESIQKLFSRSGTKLTFKQPSNQNHPNYRQITFGEAAIASTKFVLPAKKYNDFMRQVEGINQQSATMPLRVVNEQISPLFEPKWDEISKASYDNKNITIELRTPVDLVQKLVEKTTTIARLQKLPWMYENAVAFYADKLGTGELRNQADVEKAKQQVIAESNFLQGGQTIVFDANTMLPLCIKTKRSSKFEQETAEENKEIQLNFKPGVVKSWLAQAQGNPATLRDMLVSGQIPVKNTDTLDCKSLIPLTTNRRMRHAIMENGSPKLINGQVAMTASPLIENVNANAQNNKVRMNVNGAEQVVDLPQGAQATQAINGIPTITSIGVYYIPGKNGELTAIDAGEITMYDSNCLHKMGTGSYYTIFGGEHGQGGKQTDIANAKKGIIPDIWAGYRREDHELKYLQAKTMQDVLNLSGKEDISTVAVDGEFLPFEQVKNLPANTPVFGCYYVTSRQKTEQTFNAARKGEFKSLKDVSDYIQREYGLNVGPFTNVDGKMLNAANQRLMDLAQNPNPAPEDQQLAEFAKQVYGGKKVKLTEQMISNLQAEWEKPAAVKTGSVWEISINGQNPVYFASQIAAQEHMDYLYKDEHVPQGSLTVKEIPNAPLNLDFDNQNDALATLNQQHIDTVVEPGVEADETEGIIQPNQVAEEVPFGTPAEDEVATQTPSQPIPAPKTIIDTTVDAAIPEEVVEDVPPTEDVPVQPQKPKVPQLAVAPGSEKMEPALEQRKAKIISKLTKMANTLNLMGKDDDAKALENFIKKTIENDQE